MSDASVRVRAGQARSSLVLPRAALDAALWCLDHVARGLIALGVTANAISVSSVVLAGIAGALLCYGQFGWAAVAMVIASLGDALDGLVARRTGTASVAGALLDASIDRYEEFFFLGGLAVYFHDSVAALALTLLALAGSFMVSYGSAKAEALGVPVPPGAMRRAERAVFLCAGVATTPVFAWAAVGSAVPAWAGQAPISSPSPSSPWWPTSRRCGASGSSPGARWRRRPWPRMRSRSPSPSTSTSPSPDGPTTRTAPSWPPPTR